MSAKISTSRVAVLLLAVLAFQALPGLAGTPDLKTYPSADFKDQAWLQKAHKKIGTAWKRPEPPPRPPAKSVVIVTILRDGSLLDAKLHFKSGSDAWDASAVEAVRNASPFEPLPKAYPRTSLEIHFHFEYN